MSRNRLELLQGIGNRYHMMQYNRCDCPACCERRAEARNDMAEFQGDPNGYERYRKARENAFRARFHD